MKAGDGLEGIGGDGIYNIMNVERGRHFYRDEKEGENVDSEV